MKNHRPMTVKPRNPFVAAALFRRAGAHDRRDTSRQAAQNRLRKEIDALKPGS